MFNFWPFNIARKRREAFEAQEAEREQRRRAEVEAFSTAFRHKADQAALEVRQFASPRAPSRAAFSAPYGRTPAPTPTPAPADNSHLFAPAYHSPPSPAPSSYECAPSPSYDSGSSYSSDCGSSSSDSGSSSCGGD